MNYWQFKNDLMISQNSWKDQKIPSISVDYINSWKDKHPSWKYWFWEDSHNFNLWDEPTFNKYLPMIDKFMQPEANKILLIDLTRYALLYLYGGIYADIDFE